MATIAPVKKRSIYDYPEHLNPFRDEDNQSRLKFWTIGRKSFRSNSFSVPALKDFRNTWSFKSFTKKGRREIHSSQTIKTEQPEEAVTFRRQPSLSASSTPAINENGGEFNRYVYGGSVTPLPRFRFHERGSLRMDKPPNYLSSVRYRPSNSIDVSSSQNESSISNNDTMNSDYRGSVQSLQSNSTIGETRNTPMRASARKKRKAPLPPPRVNSVLSTSAECSTLNKTEVDGGNVEIDDNSFLNIELKIVEEDETVKETVVLVENELKIEENTKEDNKPKENNKPKEDNQPKEDEKISKYEEDDLELSEFIVRKDSLRRSIGDMKYVMEKLKSEESKAKDTNLFTKVDIITYKRHQSITEDNCKNKEDTVENKITINRNVSQTDNNESNDIKTVKCKLLNETNEKYKINGEAQKSKDVELEIVEIRTNGTEKKPTSNPNGRVSAMKLIFDSPSPDEKISPNSMNFPNPLPKPRRTKFLKSSSSDESTVSESSISSPTKFKENLI